MKTKSAKTLAPAGKRGFLPAVPFKLSSESEVRVPFESKSGRVSQYWLALNQLVAAGADQVLCFEDPRARGSLTQKARKMQIKILFAEQDGKLYVKLDNCNSTEIVRQMLREGPKTKKEMLAELTARGLGDVILHKELQSLSEDSQIRLDTLTLKWSYIEKKEKP